MAPTSRQKLTFFIFYFPQWNVAENMHNYIILNARTFMAGTFLANHYVDVIFLNCERKRQKRRRQTGANIPVEQ